MRRWWVLAAAAMVACGGPFEAGPAGQALPGDDAGAESAAPEGDGGEHASEAGDARADGLGGPHGDAGGPETSAEASDDAELPDGAGDAPSGPETGTVTCPGGTAALGCTDFEGTPLCVATGVNLACNTYTFSSTAAAQAQYDQFKGAGWPDCQAGGAPVPNPQLMAPGQDCVALFGMQVQSFSARCPSGMPTADGGC